MARNPYIGSKGNFNYRRWLKDASGQMSLSNKMVRYAERAGYRIGWDRDTFAQLKDRFGGVDQVGTFQLRNANFMKDGVRNRPEIGLYRVGNGSGSGSGRGSGRGSGSSGPNPFDGALDFFQATSQANASMVNKALGQLDKTIRKLTKKPAVNVDKIRKQITNELSGDYEGQLEAMKNTFTAQLQQMQRTSSLAEQQYKDRLAASAQRMQDMQSLFEGQLAASESQRAELEAAFAEQQRQTNALKTAFVPELEPTAAAPQLADSRSAEQARRPKASNSLSDLSLATNSPGSMANNAGALAGFLLA